MELLKAVARERLAAGQGVLDLQMQAPAASSDVVALPPGALPIRSSRMGHLGDGLAGVFERLGLGEAAGGDAVFRALVLARIIEPSSKLDSIGGAAGGRTVRAVVPDDQAAATGVRERRFPTTDFGRVRRPRRARPSEPGAVRREHSLLRNRPG